MSDASHRVHGVGPEDVAPDWPALRIDEIDTVLAAYPALAAGPHRISWHSPRPLSAAALVDTARGPVFIKRHHRSVRSADCLEEEHRFMAHLRGHGVPVVEVFTDAHGRTAHARDAWTYEVHRAGIGTDLYRETTSWTPLTDLAQARQLGAMLARLHLAAADYAAPQRSTHLLVARDDLIRAADPIAALQAQFAQRPALAQWLRGRDWQADFRRHLLPWHAGLAEGLRGEPRLWAHNDLHATNLLWQADGAAPHIGSVLDFGLASPTGALFDLATAIERNAIAWLSLDSGMDAAHVDTALALLAGYREVAPLSPGRVRLLATLLPLVHLDFALSEVEYFHGITRAPDNTQVAYGTFLLGHADWFASAPGQALLQALRAAA
ncbi:MULTISPECIES: phosphotransferase enzyme family protein [Pseudoxanthomonas]|jgi:Ser/Thr protein kinase RdoA (MazF antagonist)|uniref:Aminoglycoside phosphotransferase family protein n=1 Tax=Pseudoxanthomonas winnipegensis TaxID=2480810 RepID=A0A4Q8LFQ2_9GAMM|nr:MULTISPECIES: phosphotransferase [Pseudoxanthomonas]TAA28034.1 aminoglycoside phosphotransferase family protein [Pseudoxanthomonas winnipegensis]TMN24343.1 aminoglycoside phosphotransferase family protein [Pseudoxanthomonas sp. X-1]UAY73425.1 phosphotransferase [Pseudoxanthomonas sp. X-1]